MNTLVIAVGILAGMVQLAGYLMYNKTARSPNTMSWALWSFGSLISYFLYGQLVNDWEKEFLPLVCMLASLATFAICLARGLFGKPDRFEWSILALDVLVVLYWIIYREATWANLLLQIDATISFIPMLRSVWKNPSSEDPKPWLTWSFAYSLMFVTVVMRFESWWELIYPASYFLLHVTIWGITKFRPRRQKSSASL